MGSSSSTVGGGPGLNAGLPAQVTSHMSGGRDLWSPPLEAEPEDPLAAAWEALHEVLDPELPVSLVDLGLVYGLDFGDGVAEVKLTFTATACPCMEFIREDVTDRLSRESWVREVHIVEVWDPPWTTDLITEAGRAKLRDLGVGA
jgi:metal-sulfur cluster biosynthetic enzyme